MRKWVLIPEQDILAAREELQRMMKKWLGRGGGDKGRDIVAFKNEELPFNLGYQRKWIFQCKRWKKMPTTTRIINEIDTALQHKPDFWILVIPINPTPDQIDYFTFIEIINEKLHITGIKYVDDILNEFVPFQDDVSINQVL